MRSKKVNIIVVALVLVVSTALVAFVALVAPWRWFSRTVRCPNGEPVKLLLPEDYLLQYSGRDVQISVELVGVLKEQMGVRSELIREADELVQLLDQRLRVLIALHNGRPCSPEAAKLYQMLTEYNTDGMAALIAAQARLREASMVPGATAKAEAAVEAYNATLRRQLARVSVTAEP